MLKVAYFILKDDSFIVYGNVMKDFEEFENYALNELKAEKISENKYMLPHKDCMKDMYISLVDR